MYDQSHIITKTLIAKNWDSTQMAQRFWQRTRPAQGQRTANSSRDRAPQSAQQGIIA
ncbi:hypothetical protein PATSB16_25440 [Pandoraea thiooxydans]|nr:hypothetical protein PATSB16_25440 [Pandoraea thiooxydans]